MQNMKKIIVNISWSDNNYCAGVEYFGLVVATNKSLEKLYAEIASAFDFHIKGCAADGDPIPSAILKGNYKFEYKFELSALLHRLDGIVSRAAISRATGINERQIGHYAAGLHNPRPEQRKRILDGIHSIGKELLSVN
jgi:predicted RNase H-like HicB family nuclease